MVLQRVRLRLERRLAAIQKDAGVTQHAAPAAFTKHRRIAVFSFKYSLTLIIGACAIVVAHGRASSLSAQAVDVSSAKKEGKVVVYGTVVPQVMDQIHKAFEKKYGVRVEYWRGSATAVLDRATNEWNAGRPGFDVLEAAGAVHFIIREKGLSAKFVAPSTERFPASAKDKDGLITAWRTLPFGILYNTELVKPQDVPKTWDDLLGSRWKNRISMPDPTLHTTTAQFLWNLQKFMGDKWLEFVRGLGRQGPRLVESLAPVPNQVIRGEADAGITYIKYVKQYKGPIAYAPMEKYLSEPSYVSLSGKASNVNAGKLYIDYVCSAEGQKFIAEDGEFVFYPGIYPPIKDAEKIVQNTIFTENPSADELKRIGLEFRKIFYSK
jgi:ABC-type Fe3+ transport system substrate-binding protein